MSILLSFRDKRPAPRKSMLLTSIAPEEMAAFARVRSILEQSSLMQYLDKRDPSAPSERYLCIDESVVQQQYPGLDPLAGRMSGIDAFIYVYDGITSHELRRPSAPGDVRHFLGEVGFRQLLLELDKACKIHRFCAENLRATTYIAEPITKKPLIDARRESFAIHARAREVFQQIAGKIRNEMESNQFDTPPVYRNAYQFACDMKQALEPLASLAKQVRLSESA